MSYPWPGNVRELENALEYAVAVSNRQTILPEDLPLEVREPAARPRDSRPGHRTPRAARESEENQRLREVLEAHQWRRADAARALGVSRTTLWRRMREAALAPRPTNGGK
jgi:transcriptional regulator of acetoin/glycerol metabolism